jgi:hypothetical protein
MGQADPLAARCSVKGCHEQEILFWLAPCGFRICFSGKSCPREEKGEKESLVPSFFHSFLSSEETTGKTDKKIEKFNLKTAVYCLIN